MSQKGTVLMRAKEVHESHREDRLGKRHPVELHMTSFSHDGIEYEVAKDGSVEAPERLVPLFEAHGFSRVPAAQKKAPTVPTGA